MERARLIALAVVAAAAAGLGVRAIAERDAAPDRPAASDHGAAVRRPADLPRRPDADADRAARRSALVEQLPGHDAPPPADGDEAPSGAPAGEGAAPSAPVGVSPGRRRGGASAAGSDDRRPAPEHRGAAERAPAAEAPTGSEHSAPAPHSAGAASSERVEARREVDAVLLSIPLQGSVEPEQGDSPTRADGVVVDGESVEFTDEAQYTLPAAGHVNGAAGSIVFDVAPRWNGSDESNNSLLQIRDTDQWANSLQIVKNLDTLRFILVDAAGVQSEVSVGIGDWRIDEPHRVAATWGDAAMTLYVDGQPVGQAPIATGPVFRATTPIHVGSDFPGSQFASADARIGALTIYGRALAAHELR